jgi:hypothetical protein
LEIEEGCGTPVDLFTATPARTRDDMAWCHQALRLLSSPDRHLFRRLSKRISEERLTVGEGGFVNQTAQIIELDNLAARVAGTQRA